MVKVYSWSEDEVTRLLKGIELFGEDYVAVAKHVCSRDNVQARQKYLQLMQTTKGTWTSDQNAILKQEMSKEPPNIDEAIRRTGRPRQQVLDRWNYYMNPSIRRNEADPIELDYLLYLYKYLGNQWKKISEYTKGRTPKFVKKLILARTKDETKHKSVKLGRPFATRPDLLTYEEFCCMVSYLNTEQFLLDEPNELEVAPLHIRDNRRDIAMDEPLAFDGNEDFQLTVRAANPHCIDTSWPDSPSTIAYITGLPLCNSQVIQDMGQPSMLSPPSPRYDIACERRAAIDDCDGDTVSSIFRSDQEAEGYLEHLTGSPWLPPCDV